MEWCVTDACWLILGRGNIPDSKETTEMTLRQAIRVLLYYAESRPERYGVDDANRDNFRRLITRIAERISSERTQSVLPSALDASAAQVVLCAIRWAPEEWRDASRTVWATL